MSDLISRHGVSAWLDNMGHPKLADAILDEKRFPPADRLTGEWILEDVQNKEDVENNNYAFRCSECGYIDIHSKCVEVPFCWHCGASMVGDIE